MPGKVKTVLRFGRGCLLLGVLCFSVSAEEVPRLVYLASYSDFWCTGR
jgi:hypothetical protein